MMRRCLACQGERHLERVGYGVTGGEKRGGVVYEVLRCPDGHRQPRTLPLDPPPPPEDLERRRIYVMGVATGFAAGVQREGTKLAQAVTAALALMTPRGEKPKIGLLSLLLGGRSRRTGQRLLRGDYPGERTGSYAPVLQYFAHMGRPESPGEANHDTLSQ